MSECALASSPYLVGRFYPVLTVRGLLSERLRWWPVLGSAHTDEEIIGFKPLHYHIDWRFCDEQAWRWLKGPEWRWRPNPWNVFGIPLHMNHLGKQIEPGHANYETRVSRLRCKRELPAYPHYIAHWQRKLEQHHAADCLRRGVCPHRGYDLSREPVVDGVVTCPLHGLRWDVSTGKQPESLA